MKNCPYCGTELKETTFGNKFCPNCGKVEINNPDELKSNDENPSYVG